MPLVPIDNELTLMRLAIWEPFDTKYAALRVKDPPPELTDVH